jgi:hypothetical protein
MTSTDHSATQSSPAPRFSPWSPPVAVIGAFIAESAPGWLTALVWALLVLCALPFKKFRAVVPFALFTWCAGWLAAFVLTLAEGELVGFFLVK